MKRYLAFFLLAGLANAAPVTDPMGELLQEEAGLFDTTTASGLETTEVVPTDTPSAITDSTPVTTDPQLVVSTAPPARTDPQLATTDPQLATTDPQLATTDPQPVTTDPQPTEVEQPHKPYNCSATSRTDQAIAASSFKRGTSLIIDDFNSEVSQFD